MLTYSITNASKQGTQDRRKLPRCIHCGGKITDKKCLRIDVRAPKELDDSRWYYVMLFHRHCAKEVRDQIDLRTREWGWK
jgi:hypothetical protein